MRQSNICISKMNIFGANVHRWTSIFFIISFLYACSDPDNPISSREDVQEDVITFQVALPGTNTPKVITKATQSLSESKIDEIDILVFENREYAYRVKAANIISDEQNYMATFSARLRSFDGEVILYIIANGGHIVSDAAHLLLPGIYSSDVKELLNESFTPAGTSKSMVLWAQYVSSSGITGNKQTIQNVKLLRALARMDVRLSIQASGKFRLSTIQAFRAANSIQVIPDSISSLPGVIEPSIPAAVAYNINTSPVSTVSAEASLSQLYLPESSPPGEADLINATCIVIGGYYSDESELTYYRLDIQPSVEGHPIGQILRNHRYEFKIEQVNRPGYASASDAASNPSLGMLVSLLSWPNEDISYMYFNDASYFGLSDNVIELQGKADSKEPIMISTNVPDYKIELEPGFFTAEKIGGDVIEITAVAANPANGDIRTQTMRIIADGLQIQVYLFQLTEKGLEWATRNVGNFGEFVQDIEDPGRFYQWNRQQSWPLTGPVSGWDANSLNPAEGEKWEGAKNPCPSGWRLPTVEEIGILENQNMYTRMHYGVEQAGMWLAATKAEADAATFENPGSAIYFPYAGYRDSKDGNILSLYTIGYYWTGSLMPWGTVPGGISFPSGGKPYVYGIDDRQGSLVRCVR